MNTKYFANYCFVVVTAQTFLIINKFFVLIAIQFSNWRVTLFIINFLMLEKKTMRFFCTNIAIVNVIANFTMLNTKAKPLMR